MIRLLRANHFWGFRATGADKRSWGFNSKDDDHTRKTPGSFACVHEMTDFESFFDEVLRVAFLENSFRMSFSCSSLQHSSAEADLQSCHRFESDTSTESEPKEMDGVSEYTCVLAQPERHRRADTICG